VGDDDWLDVSVAQDSMCAVRADHSLWCFGQGWTAPMQRADDTTSWTKGAGGGGNVHFALKDDVLSLVATFQPPTPYAATTFASASSCGGFYCGIRADGTLWCGGANESGELGDGTTVNRTAAVQVGSSTDWTKIATSSTHTCALRNGGELYCWGSNDGGEIGDGTSWSTTPVAVVP
jgi:alpha-tubulin suppressor-like RCC1 family protein